MRRDVFCKIKTDHPRLIEPGPHIPEFDQERTGWGKHREILFDEKIGGSFHMALGAGYPETGSKNQSAIHWDMICDLRQDGEVTVDGEVIYRNGKFTLDFNE